MIEIHAFLVLFGMVSQSKMKHYKETYQEFVRDYIKDHSPFQINDCVKVKSFQNSQEFNITMINVDADGEFVYQVTSPRSHSTLPMLFKKDGLAKC